MDSDVSGAFQAVYTFIALVLILSAVNMLFVKKRIKELENRLRKLEKKEDK